MVRDGQVLLEMTLQLVILSVEPFGASNHEQRVFLITVGRTQRGNSFLLRFGLQFNNFALRNIEVTVDSRTFFLVDGEEVPGLNLLQLSILVDILGAE